MKRIITLLSALLIGGVPAIGAEVLSLIPRPAEVRESGGEYLFAAQTGVKAPKAEAGSVELFAEWLRGTCGVELRAGNGRGGLTVLSDPEMGDEAYALSVKPGGITLRGGSAGIFYGLQTLRQLVRETDGRVGVPCVEIADAPRFGYRGALLDVGRYFYPVEYVKQFIDRMARFKLNRLHWHLTDDQGWRIEIKSHPELTRVGAWRASTQKSKDKSDQDHLPHGGFYTQEQIREVVRYAAERKVTIVPEIDLPGHTMSVLAVYPELSCTGGPFVVPTEWGVKKDVLCAGNEDTYRFVEEVLAEVIELFPGEYINIGGDEVPKDRWSACPKCQKKIKSEKLNDAHELQSYFARRVGEFVNAKGRRIIGWDDILEGGVVPGATVLSWRDETGGIAAAKQGVGVIMCPAEYLYLDYYQSADIAQEPFCIGHHVPLEKVYGYEPYSKKLTPEQCRYIVGVQGNFWTEYIHSEPMMDYMAWPRLLAVAEIAWTDREGRDYADFRTRMPRILAALDREGILFRIPEPGGLNEATVRDGKARVELVSPVEGAQIFYTTNGLNPTAKGTLYTGPFEVPLAVGTQIKCVVRVPSGRSSAIYSVTNRKMPRR